MASLRGRAATAHILLLLGSFSVTQVPLLV
jgi:hypothetical protein